MLLLFGTFEWIVSFVLSWQLNSQAIPDFAKMPNNLQLYVAQNISGLHYTRSSLIILL